MRPGKLSIVNCQLSIAFFLLLALTGCRKDLCYNHDEHSISVKTDIVADWEQEWQRSYRFDWEELWPDTWQRDYEEFLPEEGSGIRALVYTGDQVAAGNLDSDGGRLPMSEGRHTVFGAGWAQENGVSMDDVNAMKHIFNSDGSVNTDALAAYEKMKLHVGENNFVTRIEDRPVIRELYGDRESTYDHRGMMPTKEVDEYGWVEHTKTVENDKFDGYGMVGTNPLKPHKKKTLRERLGSLKDMMSKLSLFIASINFNNSLFLLYSKS